MSNDTRSVLFDFEATKNIDTSIIEQFNQVLNGISENIKEANNDSEKHFKKEVEAIEVIASTLGSLALSAMTNTKSNKILKKQYPASDWFLHCHITNIVNTLLSIKYLCINGFDTQSRSLVRTLDERIYQTLILFSSNDDYELWHKADDPKAAHFKLFSRKKAILKKIKKLEDQHLSNINTATLMSVRKDDIEFYSDSIHGSALSILAGSVAYPFGEIDSGPFIPALFGRASSCTFQTLHYVIGQMAYFSYMLYEILIKYHLWKPDIEDEYQNVYNTLNSYIFPLAEEIIKEKISIK